MSTPSEHSAEGAGGFKRTTLRRDDPRIAPHLPGIYVRDKLFADGVESVMTEVVLSEDDVYIRHRDDPRLWDRLTPEEAAEYREEIERELWELAHLAGG